MPTLPQNSNSSLAPPTFVKRHDDPNAAIGLAVGFVSARAPFAAYRADRLVGAVIGQVQREHYAFAVREGRVVGYAGWALCRAEAAEAWLSGGTTPSSDQCLHGDVFIPMIVAAADGKALRCLAAHLRGLYPGRSYLGRRILPSGARLHRGRVRG